MPRQHWIGDSKDVIYQSRNSYQCPGRHLFTLNIITSTKVEIHISAQAGSFAWLRSRSTKVEIHISAQAFYPSEAAPSIYQSRNSYQCPGMRATYLAHTISTKVEIHISAQASSRYAKPLTSTKVEIHISAQASPSLCVVPYIYQSRNSYQCPGRYGMPLLLNKSTKVEIHISAQALHMRPYVFEIYQSRNSYQCPGIASFTSNTI